MSTASDETAELIDAYCAGDLDEAGCASLRQRCRQDPALVGQLAAHRGLTAAVAALAEDDGQRTWDGLCHVLAHESPSRRLQLLARVQDGLPRSRHPASLWLAAAAVLLLAFGAGFWFLAERSPSSSASRSADGGLLVGHQQGGVWLERDGQRLAPAAWGPALQPGDRLRLADDGELVLRLDEDAELALRGPARLDCGADPARDWHLVAGRLRCYLDPHRSSATPLRLRTQRGGFTVTGTSLALQHDQQRTSLQVISGTVAVDAPGLAGHPAQAGSLVELDRRGQRIRPAIGDLDDPELLRFAPAARQRYLQGRYLLVGPITTGEQLWPVPVNAQVDGLLYPQRQAAATITGGRLTARNPAAEQRYLELRFGGCSLPAFTVAYRARVGRLGDGTPEVADECPGGFDPELADLPATRIGTVASGPPDAAGLGPARTHRLHYLLVGFDYERWQPVYEVQVAIDGDIVGHGFARGQPDRLLIALSRARLVIDQITVERFQAPAVVGGWSFSDGR